MNSPVQTLKIHVPAFPPAPPRAARIGEFVADMLALAGATVATAGRFVRRLGPGEIRAELRRSADDLQTQRPAATLSLRSVAAKGWID
ncbi:MAG: hypothetical protein AD742_18560 [Methylibium sp. NZG]|nr:MAG: hypothetical protein AD742_18560 [Methylibium sp. NZG]